MKTWQLHNRLCEPYEEAGFSDTSNNEDFSFEDDPIVDDTNNDDSQQQNHQAIDYEALARANASAFQPLLNQLSPQKQQAQSVSPEDFARLTGKYVPDQAFAKALFDPAASDEARAQALSDYTNKIYAHFYKTMGMALKEQVEPLSQKLTGFEQEQVARAHAKQEKEFIGGLLKARPDLEPYKKLVPLAVNQLKNAGYSPPGKTEAEQVRNARIQVLSLVQSQLRLTNPEFSFGSKPSVVEARSGMPRMASMAGGGTNGSSRAAGAKQAPAWQSVLGK